MNQEQFSEFDRIDTSEVRVTEDALEEAMRDEARILQEFWERHLGNAVAEAETRVGTTEVVAETAEARPETPNRYWVGGGGGWHDTPPRERISPTLTINYSPPEGTAVDFRTAGMGTIVNLDMRTIGQANSFLHTAPRRPFEFVPDCMEEENDESGETYCEARYDYGISCDDCLCNYKEYGGRYDPETGDEISEAEANARFGAPGGVRVHEQ